MVPRVRWACPQCNKRYLIPEGAARPAACPKCAPKEETVSFECRNCGKRLKGSHKLSGKNITCPACNDVFPVPFALFDGDDDELEWLPPEREPAPQPQPLVSRPMTKHCQTCGNVVAARAEMCPRCGDPQPDTVYSGRSRHHSSSPNKVIACLLALFLGLLGVHKFYLGQTTAGVVYLILNIFLFWTFIVPLVFCVIVLIEGISYLTYSDDDFAYRFGG